MTDRSPHDTRRLSGTRGLTRDAGDPPRAVSPVVGVVVLVGITALLASVTLAAVGIDQARPKVPRRT